jgi:hypothetical protein
MWCYLSPSRTVVQRRVNLFGMMFAGHFPWCVEEPKELIELAKLASFCCLFVSHAERMSGSQKGALL